MFRRFRRFSRKADQPSRSEPAITQKTSESDPSAGVPLLDSTVDSDPPSVQNDPLGVTVLFSPVDSPSVDIVFVHGLGGHSKSTWSADTKLEKFWPGWLPSEPVIQTARISTLGYMADFRTVAAKNVLNIADFAYTLLSDLKYGQEAGKTDLNIGKVPVIFIVHSMGGLVVKKAYVIGSIDHGYGNIIESTCAIMFLATPHRGADLVELLNPVLEHMVPGRSSKHFISELKRDSSTLDELNEQFRHFSKNLAIFSFYETVMTKKYNIQSMVVDKNSSILGYPDETRIPLAKDHRGVARFADKDDPCYVQVRNVLKGLVARFGYQKLPGQESELNHQLRTLLAVKVSPQDDHLEFRHQRMPGSCKWILKNETFISWFNDPSMNPRVVWFYGDPGSGKSTMASYIVDHIRDERGLPCQFVYFRHGNGSKRSTNYLLRSLAYQAACQFPEFKRGLAALYQLSSELDLVIWNELFCNMFLQLHFERPLYWIIDALDESTTPSLLLSLIVQLQPSPIPIRIMFVSCWTRSLSDEFRKLASKVRFDATEILVHGEDIAKFVTQELQNVDFEEEVASKQKVVDEVLHLAQGSFLWVSLVVKEIQQCHTKEGLNKVLESLSSDLRQRYERIGADLVPKWRDGDQELAKVFLTWVIFSRFPLTIKALSRAVEPQSGKLLHPRLSLSMVCGNFVKIDTEARVTLLHHTAREYLISLPLHELYVSSRPSHLLLLRRCFEALSDSSLRLQEGLVAPDSLLFYAMTSWPYHLTASGRPTDNGILRLLMKFLGTDSVLTWICMLARNSELSHLVHASGALNAFIRKKEEGLQIEQLPDDMNPETILKLWAIDFLKIQARYGECLVRHPTSIYRRLPPFCPTESVISKLYVELTKGHSILLSVTGLEKRNWDDSLNRIIVDREHQARKVLCKDQYFAVLTGSLDGIVRIFHSKESGKIHRIKHNERVSTIEFSNSGHMLATYGRRTTKVWDIETDQEVCAIDNPKGAEVLAIRFESDDESLLICSNEGVIRRASLSDHAQGWQILESVLQEDDSFGGSNSKAPSCAAFDADCTLLAVAYKGCCTSIWNVSVPKLLGTIGGSNFEHVASRDVTQMGWNAIYGHVFGTYRNGFIFKSHPDSLDEVQELPTDADIVRCSPTGKFLVSSSESMELNIWGFEDFSLLYHIPRISMINDIGISPDGKRIYDLEECYCNVSEPNPLIRLAEPDDSVIGTSTIYSRSTDLLHAPKAFVKKSDRIEAFAVGQKTSIYCIGLRNGAISVFEGNGNRITTVPATNVPIEHMIWSFNEQYFAVADVGTRLHVKSVNKQNGEIRTVFEKRISQPIQQILFHNLGNLLLVATHNFLEICYWRGKPPKNDRLILDKHYRWINHPAKEGHILGFGLDEIRVVCWDDLTSGYVLRMKTTEPLLESTVTSARLPTSAQNVTESESYARINRVLVSQDGSLIFLHLHRVSSHGTVQEFLTVHASDIELSAHTYGAVITAIKVSQDSVVHIDRPLGFVSAPFFSVSKQRLHRDMNSFDSRLAFMNKEGWLCSVNIDSAGQIEDTKEHFFLSQDWLNTENLEMAHVTSDGRIYWPKDDEVAVISNGFQCDSTNDLLNYSSVSARQNKSMDIRSRVAI